MALLSRPFDAERPPGPSRLGGPLLGVAAAMLALLGAGQWLEGRGGPLEGLARALGTAAIHGGFIALGWVIACGGRPGWQGPAARVAVAILLAAAATRATPWGSLLYLLPPILLLRDALGTAELRAAGVSRPDPSWAPLAGAALGSLLGAHLLVSASLTGGSRVGLPGGSAFISALAYDVGASALSAEWLFRGALFGHWWRRWGFWAAAATSTAMALVRYVADPAMPRGLAPGLGAVFYLALLGLAACGLRAWSGSLAPGYLGTVAFFAAYRTLSGW